MKVVPQSFFENPAHKIILRDGLCAAIHKTADKASEMQDRYLASHALTIVLKGKLQVTEYGGKFTQVNASEMAFLPKGLYMVSDLLPQNGSFEAMVFFFDSELLHALNTEAEQTENLPPVNAELLRLPVSPTIQRFIESLFELYGNGSTANTAVTRLKLQEFLHMVSRSEKGANFVQKVKRLNLRGKKALTEFMLANYLKPLKIEDYAYLTGRSLSTFHRDFKTRFNMAPKKWLIQKRLEKAHATLQSSSESVSEVANSVGYENVPHFIKAFRKQYGITPGQFRIQSRKKALI